MTDPANGPTPAQAADARLLRDAAASLEHLPAARQPCRACHYPERRIEAVDGELPDGTHVRSALITCPRCATIAAVYTPPEAHP